MYMLITINNEVRLICFDINLWNLNNVYLAFQEVSVFSFVPFLLILFILQRDQFSMIGSSRVINLDT